jgi:hypothetical protein
MGATAVVMACVPKRPMGISARGSAGISGPKWRAFKLDLSGGDGESPRGEPAQS